MGLSKSWYPLHPARNSSCGLSPARQRVCVLARSTLLGHLAAKKFTKLNMLLLLTLSC